MITKTELSIILHGIFGASVGEGEDFLDKAGTFPKCAYFEISWTDDMASGDSYEELVTYQISVEYRKPRDPASDPIIRSNSSLSRSWRFVISRAKSSGESYTLPLNTLAVGSAEN